MFQFPGFAFINLCIQSINTWFTSLLVTPEGNNNKVSGGLPHSEIHGSKLILSSPWLIAEYHVFHRLLLPRHSPNALFALDLIQKKQDLLLCSTASLPEDYLHPQTTSPHRTTNLHEEQKLVRNCSTLFQIKSILFYPPTLLEWTMSNVIATRPCRRAASLLWLVYLTWTTRSFQKADLKLAEETAA